MKRGTPRHPKTHALARQLQVPIYSAVGILEMLWHFTAEFAREGDIGRHSDQAIADACGWVQRPDILIEALVSCGWLDRFAENRGESQSFSENVGNSPRTILVDFP